ncbi:MAG: Dyp-type peroxidase [SAR324 cluster bacterium]|nr:Dyp-type peroxidase [SAR324 cluster bacterium]
MSNVQSGILAPPPPLARYLVFTKKPGTDSLAALKALQGSVDGEKTVVGLGQSLTMALGKTIVGLRPFPNYVGSGVEIHSTPMALWCWLRGDDRGHLMHQGRALQKLLSSAFQLEKVIDGFQFDSGHDLTGYEDGTENPQGDDAFEAAVVQGKGAGLDGSSFVAVQQWLHSFEDFDSMSTEEQDNSIGRRKSDNEELEKAPLSAHVKRTAQESFEPEAFIVRRSMPWAEGNRAGLVFVAFGKSFDAFEVQLRRMTGLEDGISDAIFQFTRPLNGSYFWCPPFENGRLDLRALGINP